MGQTIPFITYWEILLLLLGRRKRLEVLENSMLPTLKPGDIILIDENAYKTEKPKLGDVIVAHHPYRQNFLLVKRIANLESDDTYFLVGDNSSVSNDSRSFGSINLTAILGKVTSRLP